MNKDPYPIANAVVEPVSAQVSPASVLVSFSKLPGVSILESSLQEASYNRFTIIAFDPVEVFVVEMGTSTCPFSALADRTACYPALANSPANLPFVGGWIGFFSYEAGLSIEKIKRTTSWDQPIPLARFCLYDSAILYDQVDHRWYLTAIDWPESVAHTRPTVQKRIDALRLRLMTAENIDPIVDTPQITKQATSNMTYSQYLSKVDRAKRYIEAGDIYQVNLSQRFSVPTDKSPLQLYRRLRTVNPSSHAAFICCGGVTILSASPELFLDLHQRRVVTRPIKGTAPRTGDATKDFSARKALKESEKDRAELTMIVDLLRNDLGRVCKFGSVRVTEAYSIEEHPTVYHQVATIEGELTSHYGWLELLRATYPGGSITGAPKIRAMQIIDELEPTARGVYCGSIGWIGLDGSMSMNIAIRTMIHMGDQVQFYAGGAIVADSQAHSEYDEIMAKAAGMMRALGCEIPIMESGLVEASVL